MWYINSNGLTQPIDNIMQLIKTINFSETKPLFAFTEWAEHGKKIDSDIQFNHNKL